MRKIILVIAVAVLLCLFAGVAYGWHKNRADETRTPTHSSNIYLDKNGCAQSGGGIHPDYCVKQTQ